MLGSVKGSGCAILTGPRAMFGARRTPPVSWAQAGAVEASRARIASSARGVPRNVGGTRWGRRGWRSCMSPFLVDGQSIGAQMERVAVALQRHRMAVRRPLGRDFTVGRRSRRGHLIQIV